MLMSQTVRLATRLFLGLMVLGLIGAGSLFLYHLHSVGDYHDGEAAFWIFVPRWQQLGVAAAMAYAGSLGVAWVYFRLSRRQA